MLILLNEESKKKTLQDVERYLSSLSYIQYGIYADGKVHSASSKLFCDVYRNMTPDEIRQYKCGVCWDTSHMIYKDLSKMGFKCKEIYLISYDMPNLPTHSFTIFKDSGKWRVCEYSWNAYRGVSKAFSSVEEICEDYAKKQNKYINEINNTNLDRCIRFFDISGRNHPGYHNTCGEYMIKCEKQDLIYMLKGKQLFIYIPRPNTVSKDGILSPSKAPDNRIQHYLPRTKEFLGIENVSRKDVMKYLETWFEGRSKAISVLTETIPDNGTTKQKAFRNKSDLFILPPYKELKRLGFAEACYLSVDGGKDIKVSDVDYSPIDWKNTKNQEYTFKGVRHYFIVLKNGKIPTNYCIKVIKPY